MTGCDVVNKQRQSHCETGRGWRQMSRHLPLSILDSLCCSLMNVHQPTILHRHAVDCSSLKTLGSSGHSLRKGHSASVCVFVCCHVSMLCEGLSCTV